MREPGTVEKKTVVSPRVHYFDLLQPELGKFLIGL